MYLFLIGQDYHSLIYNNFFDLWVNSSKCIWHWIYSFESYLLMISRSSEAILSIRKVYHFFQISFSFSSSANSDIRNISSFLLKKIFNVKSFVQSILEKSSQYCPLSPEIILLLESTISIGIEVLWAITSEIEKIFFDNESLSS